MNIENTSKYLSLLFSETNNHLRNTETKYLTISLSYLGLVSLISSNIFQKMNEEITSNTNNFIVYGLLISIGISVLTLQKWYRSWKEYYLNISKKIYEKILLINKIIIDEDLKIYWLQKENNTNKNIMLRWSADNTLYWFTSLVNLGIILKLCYDLFCLDCDLFVIKIIIPIIIILAYLWFVFFELDIS